ncbi:MAG: UDP-2,3-diacylglucosamine diphosphatase [Proteobacteria bacterium]|nr:UDP-2,3-diacylglucosamine diphosphatase [Pseudomonadota bacterium]
MARTLFISDLHLNPERPGITRAFVQFLQDNIDCEQLYILGDLFDAWVGDDDDAAIALEVAQALRNFSAAGPALFLMQGNRDFMLGKDFCQSVGGQLLTDPSIINLQGKPTLLLHGDSLCTADSEYQAFRAMTRDPKWQAEALTHSLADRRALAGQLRRMSKESNSNKAEDIMDVTGDAVIEAMQSHGVEQMIHGHTHRPNCHRESSRTRWVLGDWGEKGWVLVSNDRSLDLINFDIIQ